MATQRNYWLMKNEPETFSIDDLKREKKTIWDGIRNYQARNYMREMRPGDLMLFYHSSADPSGVAGVGKILAKSMPDESQFNKKSDYYDPKATKAKPIWDAIAVGFVKKLPRIVTLTELKEDTRFKDMKVVQKGNRLSITPVSEAHFQAILELSRQAQ